MTSCTFYALKEGQGQKWALPLFSVGFNLERWQEDVRWVENWGLSWSRF
ncbi:MAG: hypothetical protein ABSD38_17825 [Syntrophorhabdales bacterium]